MPRYIDADALKLPDEYQIDPFDEPYYRGIGNGWNVALKECRERIDSAPTISPDDVRGVGNWIPLDYSDEAYGNMYKCAKCGCSEIGEPNYCPNCGAKMEVTSDD